ncbi:MAG: hypothetical protein FJW20_17640 [Acidimicrobiia bacterium]|nr:hypothetical protein [Acidimicrobiia bacterium]
MTRRLFGSLPAAAAGIGLLGAGKVAAQLSASRGYSTPLQDKTLKSASFSLSSTGTVVGAVSGKRIKVYAVKLVASAAISVNFRDGASSSLEGAMALAANGGFVEFVNPPNFLFASSVGNSLDLVVSGGGTAAGRISYWDDDNA